MKKTTQMTRMSLSVCLNVIGALVAVTFKIPIYMDSIGTLFALGLYGPKAALLVAIISGVVSGVSFDIYSFFYIPAQFATILMGSFIYHQTNKKHYLFLCGLPTALVSAMITAGLFGGITSSSSTFFVILFNKSGFNLTFSVFLSQVIFDCLDKALALFINLNILKHIKRKEDIYAKV